MLIRELLELLKQKDETVAKIAKERLPFGEKPLRAALIEAGYKFRNQTPKGWYFDGEGEEPLDKHIEEFVPESKGKSKQKPNASIVKAEESITKVKAVKSEPKAIESELDAIDMLLVKKPNNKNRTYRGFYFDDDVLSVIEGIAAGNKSDLINEALRKVFREKGLLE